MKRIFPESRLGKWAIWMTLTCISVTVIFFLFMAAGTVDFDTGPWWDVTVLIAAATEAAGFILSILAIRKEKAVLIYCSLAFGILAVLYLLTHSLFIND